MNIYEDKPVKKSAYEQHSLTSIDDLILLIR